MLDRFEFDSDALTADHLKTLDSLAFTIGLHTKTSGPGKAAIAITGHTDTAGAEDYNKGLGQRRADKACAALQEALKRNGLSDAQIAQITTASAGETQPAVVTKDNVKEPRNRRVDIRITISSTASGAPAAKPPVILFPPNILPPAGNPLQTRPTPNPPGPSHEWVQNYFERDPLLKQLPRWARDKLIPALKDADEAAASKIIDQLNLGDKAAAVTAAVKALLETIKGRKFTPPPTPTVPPDFGPPRQPQKMPGEMIFDLPPIKF
jgi:hypothetical protein